MLKFVIGGNIDDGKSTLTGRLLLEVNSVPLGQKAEVAAASERHHLRHPELSFYTDGLSEERQKRITIDTAYRHFSFRDKRYLLIDTPGHRQYSSRFFSGLTQADAVLLLVDVTKTIQTQTLLQIEMCRMLCINKIAVLVNKMDLVNGNADSYNRIVKQVRLSSAEMKVDFIPVSALTGEQILNRSTMFSWYKGPTVLDWLHQQASPTEHDLKIPLMVTSQVNGNYVSGKLFGSDLSVNSELYLFPGQHKAIVTELFLGGNAIQNAMPGQSLTLKLETQAEPLPDMVLCGSGMALRITDSLNAVACIFAENRTDGDDLVFRHASGTCHGMIKNYGEAGLVKDVSIILEKSLVCCSYLQNKELGSLVIIDPKTNRTIGAAVIR